MAEDKLLSILRKNIGKDFVRRILDPKRSPVMDLGWGRRATHQMAWGDADGKYYVFPTILNDNGTLVDYGQDRGFDEAMKRGEFIEFDNPNDAEWFSKNYKNYWPEDMR